MPKKGEKLSEKQREVLARARAKANEVRKAKAEDKKREKLAKQLEAEQKRLNNEKIISESLAKKEVKEEKKENEIVREKVEKTEESQSITAEVKEAVETEEIEYRVKPKKPKVKKPPRVVYLSATESDTDSEEERVFRRVKRNNRKPVSPRADIPPPEPQRLNAPAPKSPQRPHIDPREVALRQALKYF